MSKKIEALEYRRDLFAVRIRLLNKGISQPLKAMKDHGLWKDDNDTRNWSLLAGRIMEPDFLKAIEKYEAITIEEKMRGQEEE